jgi:hypothetical protein
MKAASKKKCGSKAATLPTYVYLSDILDEDKKEPSRE